MRFLELLPPDARVAAEGGNPEITSVAYDSRRVDPGGLFLALKGESTDGTRYIPQAIERGAVAIVSEALLGHDNANPSSRLQAHAPGGERWLERVPSLGWAVVKHGRRAMSHIASTLYGHPERKLALNGVTGTNGKTTTSFLLDGLLNAASRKTALIGTIEYRVAARKLDSPHTTPESLDLLKVFADAVSEGVSEVCMEVSSHALHQGRVWGLAFDTAMFTNLTQDHLDYHGTMDSYFEAKQLLFEGAGAPAPRVAVINADDEYGRKLMYSRAVAEVRTYGMADGDWRAEDASFDAKGVRFRWKTPFGSVEMRSPLIGKINIYNLLAAATAAHARGLTLDQIAKAVEHLSGVPGRFERVDCGQPFTVVVDYAHTDDALTNVLGIARELVGRGGRVICVFGCGGDRDRAKRPKMGKAAGLGSDVVVVTSDNPRSEDPQAIIADIVPGLATANTKYTVQSDRRRAIQLAIAEAQSGDIVVIAGKGHEKTQTTREGVFPFDDVAEAKHALQSLVTR